MLSIQILIDMYDRAGVIADGRCLFRAIAHGSCLRKGEEAPDDSRQAELADELRAQVTIDKKMPIRCLILEGDRSYLFNIYPISNCRL